MILIYPSSQKILTDEQIKTCFLFFINQCTLIQRLLNKWIHNGQKPGMLSWGEIVKMSSVQTSFDQNVFMRMFVKSKFMPALQISALQLKKQRSQTECTLCAPYMHLVCAVCTPELLKSPMKSTLSICNLQSPKSQHIYVNNL